MQYMPSAATGSAAARRYLQEGLRSQLEQMLQQAELLQPGKTYSKQEAEQAVASFYNRNE
jgi:hypothetical protein